MVHTPAAGSATGCLLRTSGQGSIHVRQSRSQSGRQASRPSGTPTGLPLSTSSLEPFALSLRAAAAASAAGGVSSEVTEHVPCHKLATHAICALWKTNCLAGTWLHRVRPCVQHAPGKGSSTRALNRCTGTGVPGGQQGNASRAMPAGHSPVVQVLQ